MALLRTARERREARARGLSGVEGDEGPTARRPTGWAIRAIPTRGGESRPLVLFDDPPRQLTRYGFAMDGRRFYFTIGSNESDVWVMELEHR